MAGLRRLSAAFSPSCKTCWSNRRSGRTVRCVGVARRRRRSARGRRPMPAAETHRCGARKRRERCMHPAERLRAAPPRKTRSRIARECGRRGILGLGRGHHVDFVREADAGHSPSAVPGSSQARYESRKVSALQHLRAFRATDRRILRALYRQSERSAARLCGRLCAPARRERSRAPWRAARDGMVLPHSTPAQ